ncbi:MAG: hypothetical protein WAM14_06465 [Candidatus Nitrosopolaris sp.]
MVTDLAPFAGTLGGGFLVGFITGYAIKKMVGLFIKLAAVIVGLFIAGCDIRTRNHHQSHLDIDLCLLNL